MKKIFFPVLLCATVLFAGCKDDEPTDPSGAGQNGPGIYVAGVEQDSNDIDVVKVWKDGVQFGPAISDGINDADATSIFISDRNVYVAGYEKINDDNRIAKVWKNGAAMALTLTKDTKDAIAYCVFVAGNDVYVAGYDTNSDGIEVARVWKNGVPMAPALSDGTINTHARSVVVSGNDVYVVGDVEDKGWNKYKAKIWKNGIPTELLDGDNSTLATSMCISGGDIYVAGISSNSSYSKAIVWKNGVVMAPAMGDEINTSGANSVAVSNDGNVYVTGVSQSRIDYTIKATVWKNGVAEKLSSNDNTYTRSVATSKGDVYVAGYERNNDGYAVATVWKNGTEIPLAGTDPTKHSGAMAIFVKE